MSHICIWRLSALRPDLTGNAYWIMTKQWWKKRMPLRTTSKIKKVVHGDSNGKIIMIKQVKHDIWRKETRKMRRVLLSNAFFMAPSNCWRRLFTGNIGRKRLTSHTHWSNLYSHKHELTGLEAGFVLLSLGRVVSRNTFLTPRSWAPENVSSIYKVIWRHSLWHRTRILGT